jgi:hypothetical protein
MPINPFQDPHSYSPADALHDHLKAAGEHVPSSGYSTGPSTGPTGSVFSFLAVFAAGLGAFLGLLVGREDRILTAIAFALLFGVPVWLLGLLLRLLGRTVRAGVSHTGALGGVPAWVVRGAVVGAAAGAGIAALVGGVPLSEGVVRLAPAGAVVGGVLRMGYLVVRTRA